MKPEFENVEQRLQKYLMQKPTLGKQVFVARSAVVLGDVTLGDNASVWFNAVLRADINRICIGHHSNIQDNSVLHLADKYPTLVGNYVTIGHSAIVHACTIEDEVLVGMGATILDGAVVGAQSLVGANSLVPTGMVIPPGSLVFGAPAKVIRELSPEERAGLRRYAEKYVRVSAFYLANGL